ncbi:MAG: carbohydrate-binding domain-containing protein [Spirochaetales bacterium]|nr:carbohydrate-binding domain-containing protein [Spirochaetales bacterium]
MFFSRSKKMLFMAMLLAVFFLLLPLSASAQILGDVNNDTLVNITDSLLIAQYYVNIEPAVFYPEYADVDSNNMINIVDALLIAQFYINLIPELPGHLPTDPTPDPNGEGTLIQLNGNSISLNGSGAIVNGSNVTITDAGIYTISGSLNNGRIIVETDDPALVTINLNGVNVKSSVNSPLSIMNAPEGVEIVVMENTTNYLSDSSNYIFEGDDDEPNAALFSKDDMDISGKGSLIINANYNDGIVTKDDLNIKDATIEVTAVDDGIRGKNSIEIKSGANIKVTSGGDCLKSDDDEGGLVEIKKCTLDLTSTAADGIDAAIAVTITNEEADVKILSGGGSSRTPNDTISTKGIKAGDSIIIEAGIIVVDSSDDAIHSGNTISISGGFITVSSGDDGIHAENVLDVTGGEINILTSYEGIEAITINLNGGSMSVTANDDGINAAGGARNQSFLNVNGGYFVVHVTNVTPQGSTGGDAVDCNGMITTTGGTLLIHGQTANVDSAIDYDGGITNNGGFIVGVGSSMMAMAAGSNNSRQNTLLYNFDSKPKNTLINIQNTNGNSLMTFLPDKDFSSLTFSSPDLQSGQSYNVYFGGSYSGGTQKDGLYQNGSYNRGTLGTTFTVSGLLTTIGGNSGWPWPM